MNHFLLTVLACTVVGVSAWLMERREQARLYSRMRQQQQKAYDEGHKAGFIVGKRAGIREGQQLAIEEIESRPWQTVAQVHKAVNDQATKAQRHEAN